MTSYTQATNHYVEYVAIAGMDAYEPVDTYEIAAAISNVAHCADVYPQYRVNWSSNNGGLRARCPALGDGVAILNYVAKFPITVNAFGLPVGLDVRVNAKVGGGGNLTANVRVVSDRASYPAIQDASQVGVWAVTTGSTSSSSPTWVIDEVMRSSDQVPHLNLDQSAIQVKQTDDDGTFWSTGTWHMARLEIDLIGDSMADLSYLNLLSVQAREVM